MNRVSYTEADDELLWSYLLEKTRQKSPSAKTPMGIALWKEFVKDHPRFSHTVSSIQTHYRRHLHENMHKASLPFEELVLLLRKHKRKVTNRQKQYIERKFGRELKLDGRRIPLAGQGGDDREQGEEEDDGEEEEETDTSQDDSHEDVRSPRRTEKNEGAPGSSTRSSERIKKRTLDEASCPQSSSPLVLRSRKARRLVSPEPESPAPVADGQPREISPSVHSENEDVDGTSTPPRRIPDRRPAGVTVSTQTEAPETTSTGTMTSPDRDEAAELSHMQRYLGHIVVDDLDNDTNLSVVQLLAKKKALNSLLEET